MTTPLTIARSYRDGAHTRVAMGGSITDNGYCAVIDAMRDDAVALGNPAWAGVFMRAANRGAALADARQPLPGQDAPAHF